EPSADTPEAVQQQRLELSELIREREYAGLLEIGAGVYQPRQPDPAARTEPLPDALVLRYQSNSPLSGEFPHRVEEAGNDAIQRRRYEDANLSYQQAKTLRQSVPLVSKGLSKRNTATGAIEDGRDDNPIVSFLLPYGLLFLMFMMIFLGATPLMQGVVE